VAGLPFDIIQDKGGDPDREQYSGFDGTPLAERLRERGVERVAVAGIATDYCVRATALDAIAKASRRPCWRMRWQPSMPRRAMVRALAEIRAAGGTLDRVHLMRGRANWHRCWRRRHGRCGRWSGRGPKPSVSRPVGRHRFGVALAIAAERWGPRT
jgi:hypothetical protein